MDISRRGVIAAVGLTATAGCMGAAEPTATGTEAESIPTDIGKLEQLIFEQTNTRREEHDLTTTEKSAVLGENASAYSKRMVEEDFFAHTSPDGEGINSRLPCGSGGENLNEGYRNRTIEYANGDMIAPLTEAQMARYTVKSWMLSEDHRSNILDAEWSQQGVGVAVDGRGDRFRFVVTQLFCG